jgi:NAD(P)-dependent dehydrogenase (short-subunit alcohol dehydrogenase family)
LVTGASSGIGAAAARLLRERGFEVFGTSRRPEQLGVGLPDIRWIPMDICDEDSVREGVAQVLSAVPRLDALVCNAGFGIFGSVEEVSIAAAKEQFETNFFGTLRTLRAAIPHLREARRGRIAIVGSIAGRAPIPFQVHYSATKAAVESLAFGLQSELHPLGVQVILIEPGDIDTPFNDRMDWGDTGGHPRVPPEGAAPRGRGVGDPPRAHSPSSPGALRRRRGLLSPPPRPAPPARPTRAATDPLPLPGVTKPRAAFSFSGVIIHRVEFRLSRSQHIRPPAASRSRAVAARDDCKHRLDERGEIPVRKIRIAALAALVALATNVPLAQAAGDDPATPPSQPVDPESRAVAGTVVSTMNVNNYTYVEIDTGGGIVWAAGPTTELKEGDLVFVRDPGPMRDFYSTSLDRRFDLIYFGSSFQVHGRGYTAPMDSAERRPPGEKKGAAVEITGIERAAGGETIGAIFEHKAELVGREVTVRGKVVKSNSGILGRNWIHLRDGTSGPEGNDDLTVTSPTTTTAAEVGDTVLVRGIVAVEKDFGYGYRYDLIIEDATITIE